MLVAIALGLAGSDLIGRMYAREYGVAEERPGLHTLRSLIKWLVVTSALVAAMWIDATFELPVLASALTFAAAIVAYRNSTGGGRVHQLYGAAALAALDLAPLVDLVPTGRDSFSYVLGALGLVCIVCGVLDHLELQRLLPPIRDEARAA